MTARPLTQPQANALGALDAHLPGPGYVDGRSAAALRSRGLIRPAGRDARLGSLWHLTNDGALLVLAHLAGWTLPADIGDPYVIGVCALAAYRAACDQGVDEATARGRLDRLLAHLDHVTLAELEEDDEDES